MDNKPRCQSCGMPLSIGFYGLNKDGTLNNEYCKFCFENGSFREPNITVDEMIGRSIANMVDDLKMERENAETLALEIIPTLKRWKLPI